MTPVTLCSFGSAKHSFIHLINRWYFLLNSICFFPFFFSCLYFPLCCYQFPTRLKLYESTEHSRFLFEYKGYAHRNSIHSRCSLRLLKYFLNTISRWNSRTRYNSLELNFNSWWAFGFNFGFCILNLQEQISLLDPSEIYRPDIATYAEKDLDQFRDYSVVKDDPLKERVRQTYAEMHRNQTVAFVQGIFVFFFLNSSITSRPDVYS